MAEATNTNEECPRELHLETIIQQEEQQRRAHQKPARLPKGWQGHF